jgi:hypothetical protein
MSCNKVTKILAFFLTALQAVASFFSIIVKASGKILEINIRQTEVNSAYLQLIS